MRHALYPLALVSALTLLMLEGCGQTGPLYHPGVAQQTTEEAESAPPAVDQGTVSP
jgi:predicted small lipoprotein YifL